jgi:hypothetical protein
MAHYQLFVVVKTAEKVDVVFSSPEPKVQDELLVSKGDAPSSCVNNRLL